jgi:hypothetical protein
MARRRRSSTYSGPSQHGKWTGQRWESVHAWQEWLREHSAHLQKHWEPQYGGWGPDRQHFTGRLLAGLSDAIGKVMQPFPEGETMLQHARESLNEVTASLKAEAITRRPRFSENDGDDFDLDRWTNRDPDFWVDYTRVRKSGPGGNRIVDIVADFTTVWYRVPEQVAWRGAAAIVLADILEGAGYRCRITFQWVALEHYVDSGNAWAQVVVKQPQDPVDFATLAAVNSPWCYRSLGFAALCQRPAASAEGMGTSVVPQNTWPEECQPAPGTVLFKDIWNMDSAVRAVRAAVDSLQGKEQSNV